MNIIISESAGNDLRLQLPTRLALNRTMAAMITAKLRRHNIEISARQLYTLFRAIKKHNVQHPDWTLLEVESSDGATVKITV